MNKFFKTRLLFLVAAMAPLVLALQPGDLHAQTPSPRRAPNELQKVQMNAWTVGLAGGLLEGAPIRLAAEIARVVDDGPNMHVLPIVTRGATENLNSLLCAASILRSSIPMRSKNTRFRYLRSGVGSSIFSASSHRSCIFSSGLRSRTCRIWSARR